MNLFLIIVGAIIFLAGIIWLWGLSCIEDEESDKALLKKCRRLSAIGCPIGVILFVAGFCFTIVPTGFTGVRITLGQVSDQAVGSGFTLKKPFVEKIELVNNKLQDLTFDGQIWSETANRTALYYDGVTVTYQLNGDYSAWICANVTDYQESLVSVPVVVSAVKESSKQLTDTEATSRGKMEALCQENIQKSLNEKYGKGVIFISKVSISNSDFDETYNAAIAAKQQAQLEYEQQQIENKKTIEKAQAEADAKIKKAEGEAQAVKIAAEAEADANRTVADSLSEDIFHKMTLDKWDGQLPKVIGDSDAVMDVSGLLTENAE